MNNEHFVQRERRLPHWEEHGRAYSLTWHCVEGLTLEPPDRDIIAQNLRYWEGERFLLHCAVVMPSHVHCLLTPLLKAPNVPFDLPGIRHSTRSYTAHQINKRLGRAGAVWQEEGHDRIIRSPQHYEAVAQYIINNPVKWGLVSRPDDYPWLLYQAVG